jgi:O-antigen/teichoic acid export membrane protein
LASLVAAAATIGRQYRAFFRQIFSERPSGPQLAWRADILPMQWRVALSWLSGYFTFYLFTPVLFHWSGPVAAGQMGMTWALISVLTGVVSSWIAPKAPTFGILIAQRRFDELDRMFWHLSAVVAVFACAGAATIFTAVYVLNALGQPFATRLLPPKETGYLLLGTVMLCASLPMSTYLRAHKREPLLAVSLASGLITGTSIVLLGKYRGADGASLGYVLSMAIVTPFVALVWQRRRTEWHGPQHAFVPSPNAGPPDPSDSPISLASHRTSPTL